MIFIGLFTVQTTRKKAMVLHSGNALKEEFAFFLRTVIANHFIENPESSA